MDELKERVNKLLKKFDADSKRQEIRLIEEESLAPTFWQDSLIPNLCSNFI